MALNSDALLDNAREAEVYLKALANQNRLMILCTLMGGEMSVGELNQRVKLSQSALSQHLALLRDLGFVETRKEAQIVYYQVSDPKVTKLLENFENVFCSS